MEESEAIEKGLLMMIGEEIDEAYYAATETLLQYPELMRVHGGELKLVYTPLHGSGCVPVRTLLARVGVYVGGAACGSDWRGRNPGNGSGF